METPGIPLGWVMTTLGSVFKWGSGGTPLKSINSYYEGGDIPWAIIGDLHDGIVTDTQGFITQTGLENSSAKWVEEGSVLIAMYGSIGKLGIAGKRLTTNQAIAFTQPNPVNNKYLFYYLLGERDNLFKLGSGATQLNISQTVLKAYPFPMAPVPEQERIVERIESLFTQLDAGVAGLKRVQAALKRYKASVLKAACEGHCSVNSPRKKIDGLPKGWRWTTIKDITDNSKYALKAGPFGSSLKKEYYVPKGYKIYGQEQVIRNDPYYGNYYISEERYQQLKSNRVKPGDILISLVGTIGKVLILPADIQPGIINPRLVKLSLDNKAIDARYFKIYLETVTARHYFSSVSHGETMDILNLGILKKLPIPLPPLFEQQGIVAEVEQRLSVLEAMVRIVDANLIRAQRLRQAILKSAFEGKLLT